MELRKVSFPSIAAKSNYSGSGEFQLTDGKFKIKLGEDWILDEKVPNGKKWDIKVTIAITEVDE